MKRRIAIRNLVLLSAGAAVLDACGGKQGITYRNIELTGGQQDMLSELAEMIIPKTADFVGANDLNSREFTLMMIDDMGTPDQHKLFLEGMEKFDEACKTTTGNTFSGGSMDERKAFIYAIEAGDSNSQPGSVMQFYHGVKHFTIQSFTTSEAYLTTVQKYSLIPEKFQGCVPVASV